MSKRKYKFQIGDRVKYVDRRGHRSALVGTIAEVMRGAPRDKYRIAWNKNNSNFWYSEDEMVLISKRKIGELFIVWNGKHG